MRDYLMMIALALATLLLGDWLPGGTCWLTPLASLALVLLAYFGRQSPAVLLAVIDGEWRAIGAAAWAHAGPRTLRLMLLALPVWLIQSNLLGVPFQPTPLAVLLPNGKLTASQAPAPVRAAPIAVRVWEERAAAANPAAPEQVVIETSAARLSLPAQASNCPLGTDHPAVEVHTWRWANADLLPETVVTIYPVLTGPGRARPRTFYIPLLNNEIREQDAGLALGWTSFQLGFPWMLAALLLGVVAQGVKWLHRQLRRATPSNSR